MFTTCQPIALNQRDSAAVENRGPLMTTIVPPSITSTPARRPAAASARSEPGVVGLGERLVVHRGAVVEGVGTPPGAIDELVDDHELAGIDVGLK